MNIYQKISAVRTALLKRDIGKDKKAFNYSYIDLPQIEGAITEECAKVQMITLVDFPNGLARITAYDLESDKLPKNSDIMPMGLDYVSITVPCDYTLVEIKGSQPIQKVGGMMTYMRRYLYMQMFAISEHDAVEGIGKLSQESANKNENAVNTDTAKDKTEDDKKRKAIIEKFKKDLPDYIPQLEAYKKTSIDQMPIDFLEKTYATKMKQLKKTEEKKEQNDGSNL